jgi:hypothetical protein
MENAIIVRIGMFINISEAIWLAGNLTAYAGVVQSTGNFFRLND